MTLNLLIVAGLAIPGLVISFEDIRRRLVSAWAVLAYMLACLAFTCAEYGLMALLENAVSVLIYFLLCFSVLTLYYYLKEKKLYNVIDTKIGMADVLLILGIGVTLDLKWQVVFFMLAFSVTALCGLLLMRRNQTIPLAAFLVWQHVLFLALQPSLGQFLF